MISLPFIAPFVRNKFVNQMPHESFACENKLTCLVIRAVHYAQLQCTC